MPSSARPPARKRAQALVELALILPIMLLLGLASIDFGRAYFAGVALMQGAREGARYAASSTGTDVPSETQAKQRVIDAIGGFVPAQSSSVAGDPLSTGDVAITVRDMAGNTIGYTARASGYAVETDVSGFVPFYTGFLAEGVDGFAPGLNLCMGSGASKRCGITVRGQAFMIVL